MQQNRIIFLILKIIWVLLFIYLGYISYDISGEASMGFMLIDIALTFPSGILFLFVIRGIDSLLPLPYMSTIVSNIFADGCFFAIGYFQWFVFLPWLIRRWKKIISARETKNKFYKA